MRINTLVGVLAAATVGAAAAESRAQVQLVRDGKQAALSSAAQARIAQELPRLFSTCSLNSRDHANILRSSPAWDEAAAKNHLVLRLAVPTDVAHPHHAPIPARELLLGLADAHFPGPELSRNGDSVVTHTKCLGGEVIKFVCAAEIRPLMPASYLELCRLVDTPAR